jgi:hypothetical protein
MMIIVTPIIDYTQIVSGIITHHINVTRWCTVARDEISTVLWTAKPETTKTLIEETLFSRDAQYVCHD